MERSIPKKEGLDHLVQNIRELKKLIEKLGLPWIASQLNSIVTWENNIKSIFATCCFVGVIYVFQPWMASIPIFLMFLKNCQILKTSDRTRENPRNNEEKKDEKKTIMETFSIMNNTYHKAGEVMELLVHWTQRIIHFTEFKVPLLSGIAIGLLALFTLVLSLIPFRFIIMALGVKVILKNFMMAKYPHYQGMGKFVLNFLSKMPDNEELNRQTVNVSHVAASKNSENVNGDQEEDMPDPPSIASTSGSNISISDEIPTNTVTGHSNLRKFTDIIRIIRPNGILQTHFSKDQIKEITESCIDTHSNNAEAQSFISNMGHGVCPNNDDSTFEPEDGSNNYHVPTAVRLNHPRKDSKSSWYHEIDGSEMSEMSETE